MAASVIFFASPHAGAQDVMSGVEFYLPFDGSKVEQVSKKTPTDDNGTSLVEGKFGQALRTEEGIIYDVELTTDKWPSGSVAAWVKVDEDAGSNQTVIATRWHSQMKVTGNRFVSGTGSGNWATSPAVVPQGTWSHLAMTWTRSADEVLVKYYLDAQLVYSENVAYRTNADWDTVRIGRWSNADASPQYTFKGAIDDLVVYKRTLADADIAALFHQPLGSSGNATSTIGSIFGGNKTVTGPTLPEQPALPTDKPLPTPTRIPDDRPEATERAQSATGTDWEIVSVHDLGGNAGGLLDARENLSLNVRVRKTGADAPLPIRIQAKQVQANANWQGSHPGIKYNVDGEIGEIKTIVVPVNYQTRFEAGAESYVFNLELTHPDGSPLKDANADNNVKRMNYGLKEKRQARAEEAEEEARKEANKGYKRRVRRSGVAGATGDRVWRQVAPKGAVLRGLSLNDRGEIGGFYHTLKNMPESAMPTLKNIYGFMNNRPALYDEFEEGRVHSRSMISAQRASFGVFGLRVRNRKDGFCIYICIGSPRVTSSFEFWMRDRSGSVLGQDLTREIQWPLGPTSENSSEFSWRPWQYCPKDSTGQRMIAIGFEAHIEEDTNVSHLIGIRLICEPLSQALDPREGPVQYFNADTGKWVDG